MGRARPVLGVVVILGAIVAVVMALVPNDRQPLVPQERVAVPSPSAPPPGSTPSGDSTTESQPVVRRVPTSPMTELTIPALNRSFAVEGVSLGNPIDPPFDTATVASTLYYEADRSYGGADPGTDSSNTVYVTGHTWRGGEAAMNVIDRNLRKGDELLVGTVASERRGVRLRYVVQERATYDERRLPGVDKMWEVAPGRLIILTCNLRQDGAAQTQTRVFYAQLTGTVPTN